jgi:hypothetical protein
MLLLPYSDALSWFMHGFVMYSFLDEWITDEMLMQRCLSALLCMI